MNETIFDLALVTPTGPVDEFNRPKPDGPSADVLAVFEFWVETLRSDPRSRSRTKLTDERRKKIERALKNYDVETCKSAILGCSESDFHMGRNGRGRKYDDIELILRDAKHIEEFARLHEEGE
jgi:hypothetical protein